LFKLHNTELYTEVYFRLHSFQLVEITIYKNGDQTSQKSEDISVARSLWDSYIKSAGFVPIEVEDYLS
tara:strand:+ start:2259 stop:2462 length:204 start_codon:yes stop_codon:yes gene_type:complete